MHLVMSELKGRYWGDSEQLTATNGKKSGMSASDVLLGPLRGFGNEYASRFLHSADGARAGTQIAYRVISMKCLIKNESTKVPRLGSRTGWQVLLSVVWTLAWSTRLRCSFSHCKALNGE